MSMKRSLAICSSAFALACSASPRPQVLVTVHAEPGVRALSQSSRVRMWGRAADAPFDDALFLEETGTRYPWVVALRPQNDDASRIFRFEANAYTGSTPDNGNFVAQARVISGYTPGRVLHVYLLLTDACIGIPCEQLTETCRGGRCVQIPDATFFDPDAGFPDSGRPPCGTPSIESCDHDD